MLALSQRAQALQPSATLAMSARAKALAAAGHDVINLTVGEPDFDTPAHIKQAAKDALDAGFTKYTQTGGIPELKEAIARKLKRDHGLDYSPDEIVVTCGGKHAIYNALMALVNPGDEVIIPVPYWVSFPEQVKLCGGIPRAVETGEENAFRLTPQALDRAITPRTRAIILNTPSNPTGAAYPREALAALVEVALRHRLAIISDEIYEQLVYDGFSHCSPVTASPQARDCTVIVNGVSKAYAMTGWRMGFAAGPRQVIAKMQAMQDQQTSSITSFVQRACIRAFAGPQDELVQMRAAFQRRRDLMFAELTAIAGIRCTKADGAFFLFPNVRAYLNKRWQSKRLETATDISTYLLETAHVATVGGDPFGAPGYLRLSYAASEDQIREGMQRMRKAFGQLV